MSLNITNLLNTLQGFYDSSKGAGSRYAGAEEGLSEIVSAYGLSNVIDVELTEDALSKTIPGGAASIKITVASSSATKFSYKIDEEKNKIIIFGNNLSISVDEFDLDLVEVVGISNEINTTSHDDKITLFGYDNKVNAKDGKDTVTVYGEDNRIKDSEINIFNGLGGQYLVYDDKEFLAYLNKTDNETQTELKVEKTSDGLKFTGNNISLSAQDDVDDKIELVGNKNYLDTSAGADEISVKGNDNIIVSGVDNEQDIININGSGNQIVGGEEDKVHYSSENGSITIGYADNSQHYVTINGKEYVISRNTSSAVDVKISYEVAEDGTITFIGNNANITAVSDEEDVNSDDVIVIGDNNLIDMSVGDDVIAVKGDGNVIITGEGTDSVLINGKNNQVQGDSNDEVYYTASSGSVTITPEDESKHYIVVGDYEYSVARNTEEAENVTFSYNVTESGVFEFTGDYFKLIATGENGADRVKVVGNYNYVDTSTGDDRIDVIGDNNVITAGEGNDSVVLEGNNNEAQGDAGKDGIAVVGDDNITENFEYKDELITLNVDNQFQTVTFDNKKYTVSLTSDAIKAEKEVRVIVQNRDGVVTIEADDIVVEAGNGQEDIINFIGNNSKIFAKDKDDIINVWGNSNFIDGWTGNDKITATGRNNNAYGFLGDDEINIIQKEATEDELNAEIEKVDDKDSSGNQRTVEEKTEIARQTLNEKNANTINGEFGTNTVNASYYTNIQNAQIYTSLHNKVDLGADEKEKKIVVEGKTYTIKNYINKSNNPFASSRTLSYEMQDVEVDGVIKRQLVIEGSYISVVADENQEDNVKIIGNYNYADLSDADDYLEAQGTYNLLLVGRGDDKLKVSGDENKIQGGAGNDSLQVEGNNTVWQDVETVTGLYETRLTLTAKEPETTITVGDGLTYTVKINAAEGEEITGNVQFTYSMIDGELIITGDKLHIIANAGQADNLSLKGSDCIIELGDEDDIVSVKGTRNEIYAGDGDDKLNLYGDSFKAFGGKGVDDFEVRGITAEVYADDEEGAIGDDVLKIVGTNDVVATGFKESNISRDLTKGIIVVTAEGASAPIRYKDVDGKEIVFNVDSNILDPSELAGNIYVDWEVVDIKDEDENIVAKQLIVKGNSVSVTLDKGSDKSVCVKIIGSNIRLQTYSGDDFVEVEGDNNKIVVGELIDEKTDGENVVTVKGSYNTIYGGKNIDEFNIDGNSNEVYGGGESDKITMNGVNNTFQIYEDGAYKGGSFVVTKDNQPQMIVIKGATEDKDRAYRISLYNVPKASMETIQIPVEYIIDSEGYINFKANNIKIEAIDNKTTPSTDENITDNQNFIRLVGNNCHVTGTNGIDIIKVNGDNNLVDGWYGSDSIIIEDGDNNEIRGFDGDDHITITKGNGNYVNGEDGEDTLDIFEGQNNTYENVEKVTKQQ